MVMNEIRTRAKPPGSITLTGQYSRSFRLDGMPASRSTLINDRLCHTFPDSPQGISGQSVAAVGVDSHARVGSSMLEARRYCKLRALRAVLPAAAPNCSIVEGCSRRWFPLPCASPPGGEVTYRNS